MPKIITEDMIEQAAIKALQERHDYTVLNCMTAAPDTLPDGTGRKDKKQVVLPDVMFERLCRINPDIPEQTVRTVVDELCHTPVSGDLMLTNYQNYQKIRNGITVEYNKNGKKTSNILRLLSYNDALSNTFTVASQMWIKGETHWRRPDLIIFINGFRYGFH
ncbi:MAG: type I restriction endonuclease [Oscillospiraceae bacterium]